MGVSNKDGNTSESNKICQNERHRNKKREMQDAIMKVMTKIFSAKVVLERLPDSFEHRNVIIKEEINFESVESNYDPIPAQEDMHKILDKFPDTCVPENSIVKEEIIEPEETNCDSTLGQKPRNWKSILMSHLFIKICPKNCSDKFHGKMSSKRCRKCKHRFTFKCYKCNKTLTTYDGIMNHLSTKCNFQGDYYQCPACCFQSPLRYTVVCHVKNLHAAEHVNGIKQINREDYEKNSRKFVYNCSKCGQGFRKRGRFINHCKLYCDTLEHAIDKSYENECKEMEGGFDIPDKLLAKEMCVHYCSTCDKEKDFQDESNECSDCNKTMLIRCSKCNQTNKKVKDIMRHLKNKCAVRKKYKCSKCEYTNAMQMLVLEHYVNVHDSTPVECRQCGSILKNKRSFTVHKRYCNKEANLFCNIGKCSFKTHNPDCLRSHKKRHSEKNDCDCPKCGKTFINRVTMKTHLFSCGKPPRFRCDDCPYASKHKRDLQSHILRKHLRDINNDYDVCPKCGVVFKDKKLSKGHLHFCGTSKPHYNCNFCYFMTHVKYNLQVHTTKIHPEKIDNDETEEE